MERTGRKDRERTIKKRIWKGKERKKYNIDRRTRRKKRKKGAAEKGEKRKALYN